MGFSKSIINSDDFITNTKNIELVSFNKFPIEDAALEVDTDNDGVTDDKDACPNTPSGETVDANGCSDSQTLGIEDEKFDKLVKFYPNPVTNTLSIKAETILIEKVEIYSYLGIKIDEINSDYEHIQTVNLSKGIYIIKISSEKGSTIRRLIKQ